MYWLENNLITFAQRLGLVIVVVAQAMLFWDLFIAGMGLIKRWRDRKRESGCCVEKGEFLRFAFVVPAHNEASVIGYLLESLSLQEYPKDKFDVYVAADRCSDETVQIAQRWGANVIERWQGPSGKGANLAHAFEAIPLAEYDAVIIVDADNLVDVKYLKNLNQYMNRHPSAKVVQTYLDVKNPRDGWIPRAAAISYWVTNSLWQDARDALSLSPTLGGTGMVIKTNFLLDRGWRAQSLTEDLELHAELVASGERVYWCHTARVYDEKPTNPLVSYKQRVRWYQGHFWVAVHYASSVLKRVFERSSGFSRLVAFDTFLYLLAPWRNLLITFLALCITVWNPYAILLFFGLAGIAALVASIARWGKPKLEWIIWSWSLIPYSFLWLPVAINALIKFKNQKVWIKTPHNARVDIKDIR